MPGDDHAQLGTADEALGRVDPGHHASFRPDALDLAVLEDVHAHVGTGPRIAPGHGVMPPGAAARLVERTEDRIARPTDVHDRHQLLHLFRGDPLRLHPLQQVGMHRAQVAPHLVMRLRQHQQAAREHDVVVQVPLSVS